MIVTTSIAEGDSRVVCLDPLTESKEANIIRVIPAMTWPGEATVTVACLWLHKGYWTNPVFIGDKPVSKVGTDFHDASVALPKFARLACNVSKCWRGTEIKGLGFILNDQEVKNLLRSNAKTTISYLSILLVVTSILLLQRTQTGG